MANSSFQQYGHIPSAIISDGVVPIPLWAVTSINLSETYQLPPLGSTSYKAIVSVHEDKVTLSGVLVGPLRSAWKFVLETLAEASKRGTAISSLTGGKISGLILITSLTIMTDMQIESLTFSVSAQKRDVIDVSIALVHLPTAGFVSKLPDMAGISVGALADFGG